MSINKVRNDRIFASRFHHRTAKFIDKFVNEPGKFETPKDAKAMLSAVIDFYTSNRLDRFPTEVEDMIRFMVSIIKELGQERVRDMLRDDPFHSVQVFDITTDDPKTPGGKSNRWHIDMDDKICLEFDVGPIPTVE